MKNRLVGVLFLAIGSAAIPLQSAVAASSEDDGAISSLKSEIARLREENALLRERGQLRKENRALHTNLPDQQGTAPAKKPTPSALSDYAADMPTKGPLYKAQPLMVRSSWDGVYIGLGLGSRWTETAASVTAAGTFGVAANGTNPDAAGSMDVNHSAFRLSPYFGYNWQISPTWVGGVEGDFGWSSKTSTINGASYPALSGLTTAGGLTPQTGGDSFSLKSSWDASARARLGFLVRPDVLLYGTGGAAWIHMESTSVCNAGSSLVICTIGPPFGALFVPGTVTDGTTKLGWTLGGGIEAMLGSNWIVRADYRYTSYGTISNTDNRQGTPSAVLIFGVPNTITSFVAYDLRVATQTVTFGLGYKFDSSSLVARY
jgi:outer membrane immunogenic protein